MRHTFDLQALTPLQRRLRRDLLELNYRHHMSHLGSCLSCLDAVEAIHQVKKKKDLFVLSNGHAAYALYVVQAKHKIISLDEIEPTVHPNRLDNPAANVSTGSLGQGLPIAMGLALANPKRMVYCMTSDGECFEGSMWESFRLILDRPIPNLMIIINVNGWGANSSIDIKKFMKRVKGFGFNTTSVDGHALEALKEQLQNFQSTGSPQVLFCQTEVNQLPFLRDQDAHYYVMTEDDYHSAMELLR